MANITINRISSRGTTTRRGDGGMVERVLTLAGMTSKAYNTLAQARSIETQLHELVWYSRQAGGLYVNSSEYDVDDGLYLLDSVDTSTEPATVSATYVIQVTLGLIRVGGATANVSRTLYALASLQANSWAFTSNLWYARPIGANRFTLETEKSRAGLDGSAVLVQTATSHAYSLSGADYNTGECKVWETDGTSTMANWTRVYSPDHEFVSADRCAFGNNWVVFRPSASRFGQHSIAIYDADDASVRELSFDVLVGGALGSAWLRVLVEELTPWRVIVSYWFQRGTAPFFVKKRYTLERGKLMALCEVTTNTAATITIGHLQGGVTLRWAFGNNTSGDRDDAWDLDYDSGATTITDIDDNWLAVVASDADYDVMGVLAVRTNADALVASATIDSVYSEKTSTTSHTAYVGGLPYDKTTAALSLEAENGTRSGTAAITTVASASPGGSNNAVTLPAVNDYVEGTTMASPPTLGGAGSIIVKAYARIQNVGVSASDTVRLSIWNATAGSAASTRDFTFAALAATGTWKWISFYYTTWNGTDLLRPRVIRQVAGGGGTLYVDQLHFINVYSGAASSGFDGPKYVGNAALTEATVWTENSRVGV